MYINYNRTITSDEIDYGISEYFPRIDIQASKVSDTMALNQNGWIIKLTEYQAEQLHCALSLILGHSAEMHEGMSYYESE